MRRHELTDDQWERLAPLLPAQRPATGRPARDHRTIRNGILWILRTGAPWRDLPERYGSWKTVYRRLRRWQQAGIWDRVLTELQRAAAHDGQIDGSITMIDRSSIRAHQHAAGARKKGTPTTMTGHSDAAGAVSGASGT
jgi:transposase